MELIVLHRRQAFGLFLHKLLDQVEAAVLVVAATTLGGREETVNPNGAALQEGGGTDVHDDLIGAGKNNLRKKGSPFKMRGSRRRRNQRESL